METITTPETTPAAPPLDDVPLHTQTESLENGVRPSTPPGDNLTLDAARADAAAFASLARARGSRVLVDPDLGISLTDGGLPTPYGNIGHLLRPVTAEQAARTEAAIVDFYRGAPGGPFFVFDPWSAAAFGSPDLEVCGHPPVMARPPGPLPATEVPGVRIGVIDSDDELASFEETLCRCYPVDELLPFGSHPPVFAPGIRAAGWHLVVASIDDRPVATAAAFVTDAVTIVEMVSTAPECRGRGIGRAVTAAAIAAAAAVDRPAVLVASDPGRPVYEALGFLALSRQTLWIGSR